jgi:histone-lysine N-methyltransferase SETMAR
MEIHENRAVIKYFHLKGLSASEIIAEMNNSLGESAPSKTMVYKWIAEFKRGNLSTNDGQRTGRPKEVKTEEMIDKIHDIVLNDRRVKLREIVNIVNISYERVWNILNEHLHMKKLSARWVPRLLTIDQKRVRVTISKHCLELFKHNPSEFLRRFITVDETWVHHFTPESKQQSKQWIEAGSSAPKKAKVEKSAGKVMATVFWDSCGIIFIDYLEKGKTITGEYYAALLDRLNNEIKQKRPHLVKKKVLFHQDNAPSHTSAVSMAKIHELRYELLPHPPYSPDLAPSDFFLFPNLKKWLGGKRFTSNEELITETNAYFDDFDKSYYSDGIKKCEYRWNKCIELKGDYVEK